MCGITGLFDMKGLKRIDNEVLVKMSKKLFHRGPDDSSTYVKGNIGLGFQRLSIIDLKNGMQPMFNENKTIVCICNGEIFNYRELRADLVSKNHKFVTNSDIEILPHLYEEYGNSFINKLNGQFAFVIFDSNKNQLLVARDHFGIVPLFYCIMDGIFIFSSEIKSILEHPVVSREVNVTGLDQIFSFPGLISPITMFKNIYSLPCGHFMNINVGRDELDIVEYWDLSYPKSGDIFYSRDESFYLESLYELLTKSIKYRLNADVPVGFYLSGGLDSSIVVSLAKRIFPEKVQKTFSVTFPYDQLINEATYQRLIVDHCQTQHYEYQFKEEDISERLKKVIYHSECPLKESYNTAAIALSENVRKNDVKVVLLGQGADEFFAGYQGYKFDIMRANGQIANRISKYDLQANFKLWGDQYFYYENLPFSFGLKKFRLYSELINQNRSEVDCLNQFIIKNDKISGIDPIHRRSYIDFKLRLSDHLLGDHGDRMVMANSVEARYPFLDKEVVEFVKTIPPFLKLNDLNEKYILKNLAKGLIPDPIIYREKFGFTAPGSSYLIKQNNEYINDLLSYGRIKAQGYFNPDEVERLKEVYSQPNFRVNVPFDSDFLMTVLTFNIFLDIFNMPRF